MELKLSHEKGNMWKSGRKNHLYYRWIRDIYFKRNVQNKKNIWE